MLERHDDSSHLELYGCFSMIECFNCQLTQPEPPENRLSMKDHLDENCLIDMRRLSSLKSALVHSEGFWAVYEWDGWAEHKQAKKQHACRCLSLDCEYQVTYITSSCCQRWTVTCNCKQNKTLSFKLAFSG